MRLLSYAVAVLVAAGFVYYLSQPSDKPVVDSASAAVSTPTDGVGATQVVLRVPGMHCPHGCYPTVKETLAAQPGVKSVELAKQSDPDAIDNPEVTVLYTGQFDTTAAIDALAKAGFEGSTVSKTN